MSKLSFFLLASHPLSHSDRIPYIVLKISSLMIGIVDRIKINSELLFPFSQSAFSCPLLSAHCTFQHILHPFLFRGNRSGMNNSSSATCLLYSDVVKGKVPRGQGKIRKRIKKKPCKRQSRSRRFSFHNFHIFFNYFTFYHFFFLPTTFTHIHTHDP